MIRMCLVLALSLLTAPLWAQTEEAVVADDPRCSEGRFGPRHCIAAESFARDTCTQIEAEARLHGLPPAFLARLLWQESRFDPNAVSPMRAMGIAQFIASTARLRGLDDPFNPAEAIEKSAEYLGDMTRRYGNVGLAAIGYNGGERRVEGFMAGTGGLARETINYVRIITGETAETWRDDPPAGKTFDLDADTPFLAACEAMAVNRRLSPLAAPEPRFAPWGVQVGYGESQRSARASYDRLTRSCRNEAPLASLQFVPVDRRGPGRKPIIAARISAQSRDEAMQLCRAISRAGCICRAYRN